MRKHLLLLLISIVANTLFADIAFPKYREEKKALIISGTQKYKQYEWHCKLEYKNHDPEEFTITDDIFILKDIYYDERFTPIHIWAINKTSGIKTEVAVRELPDGKLHLKIKGVKKNKIKIKEVQNSKVVLSGALVSADNTGSKMLQPLILTSLLSLICIYMIHKYLSPKKQLI